MVNFANFEDIKEKIEAEGWVYLIGSKDGASGLYKAKPDGSEAQMLYKYDIAPSFGGYLNSIWKFEDGWLFFHVTIQYLSFQKHNYLRLLKKNARL